MRKKILFLSLLVITALAVQMVGLQSSSALSGSQFKAGRIIDDSLFFNGNTMTATQVQAFLNAKVPVCDTNGTKPYAGTTRKTYSASKGVSTPFICLKDYKMNTPTEAGESGLCSVMTAKTNRTAAQIIDDVSRACGVSQKVLIVLLQKEQSLVTDDWPWPIQYRSATGYGCPDTAACDTNYYGFFNQVYNAARQFKRYGADPTYFNYRARGNNYIQYNPNSACGGSTIYIENQATAGLYNYTPYQPNAAALSNLYGTGNSCSSYGNRNFWRTYVDWFGATTSGACVNGANVTGANPGRIILSSQQNGRGADSLVFAQRNNTGSTCVEAHTWNAGYTSWQVHRATNLASIDPTNNDIISGNILGDSRDELILVKYASGSGKVELHSWSSDMGSWAIQAATPLPSITPSTGTILSADVNGDGRDEIIYINYSGTGGRMEVHILSSNFKTWVGHYLTNLSGFNPATDRIIAGDLNRDGRDELMLVKYSGGASGRVEVHTLSSDFHSFTMHRATVQGTITPSTGEIISSDVNGDGRDELVYIKYRGGSGMVEAHTFSADLHSWARHNATNLGGFTAPL